MYPASTEKLQLVYIYDNTSHKDDEMKHDQDVNVSFLEPVGGDWISVAGNAITTTDRSEVAKYYSASTKAWFADLGDGVHDGSGNDPRVSVMKVKPTEVSCAHGSDIGVDPDICLADPILRSKGNFAHSGS